MEMQEMIKHLLAGQAKAYREQILAEMKADRKADQEKAEANRKNIKEMMKATQEDKKSGQAEMRSTVDVWMPDIKCARKKMPDIKDARKKTTACNEATEADTETEPYSGVMQSVAEHQVALEEDAVVKPAKGRKPAAGRRGEPKELTRSHYGTEK
jgi:hypothetical protein